MLSIELTKQHFIEIIIKSFSKDIEYHCKKEFISHMSNTTGKDFVSIIAL